jgi:hypothetical protein
LRFASSFTELIKSSTLALVSFVFITASLDIFQPSVIIICMM